MNERMIRRNFSGQSQLMIGMIVLFTLINILGMSSAAAVPSVVQEAPLNPAFIDYLKSSELVGIHAAPTDGYGLGLIPSPWEYAEAPQISVQQINALSLPASYDLRAIGQITPVRDQSTAGCCWAFATYGSLESALLGNGESWDFSENNLKNTHGFDLDPDTDGGNGSMAAAYLTRWSGPVAEADDPFNPASTVSPNGLPARKHVQEVIFLPNNIDHVANKPLIISSIKQEVYNGGAVFSNIYWTPAYFNDTYDSYHCNAVNTTNHAVTIVGWDDNYPSSKFTYTPAGNGAFIIKNSWGTSFGEGGYFYLSYYDINALGANMAFHNAEPIDNYDNQYEYDPLGVIGWIGSGSNMWGANIFTAAANESLAAVSFYTPVTNSGYIVNIYRDPISSPTSGVLAATATISGSISTAGYHTLELATPVQLTAGQRFSVVLYLNTPGYNYQLAVEKPLAEYSSQASASPGQSYYSVNGSSWSDLTQDSGFSSANICLKAFSVDIIPEMDVSGNASPIVDGATTPSVSNHTDFGSVDAAAGNIERVFTIRNTGSGELTLTGMPKVSVSGPNAGDFGVMAEPAATVAPGGITNFTVRFDPSAPGIRSAGLSIANNDSDENPYNFSIQGMGMTPIEVFIARFYQLCLLRTADAGGLVYWVDQLATGQQTGANVAQNFIFSDEFIARNLSDSDFLDIMYSTFFNRTADSGGKVYWQSQLDYGMSRLFILASFVNSPEFGTICSNYGITRGSITLTDPADLHPPVTAFVNRFYVLCMDREPDSSGLNYWVDQLVSGQQTGADISQGFIFSPEFTAKNLDDTDFVTVMYRVFFDREPDSGGQAYWVDQLDAGTSRLQVLAGFVGSPEFSAICSGIGIPVGAVGY